MSLINSEKHAIVRKSKSDLKYEASKQEKKKRESFRRFLVDMITYAPAIIITRISLAKAVNPLPRATSAKTFPLLRKKAPALARGKRL